MSNSSPSIVPISPTQLPTTMYPKECNISDHSEYVTPFLLELHFDMISGERENSNESPSLIGSWEGGDLLPPFKHDPSDKTIEQKEDMSKLSENIERPLSFHMYNDRSNLLYETNCSITNKKGYVNLSPKSTKSIRSLSQLITTNWLKESSPEKSNSSPSIKVAFDGEFMIEHQLAHEVTLSLTFSLLHEKDQSFNGNLTDKRKYLKILGEGVTMGKVGIHFILKGEAALDMVTGRIGMKTPIILYRFDQPPLDEISDERSYVHKTIKPLLFSRGWTFPSHPPRSFTLLYEGSCWKPPSGDWKNPKQGRDFIHKSHLAEFLLGDDKAFVDEIFRGLGVKLLVDMLPGLRQRLLVKERIGISSSSISVENISQIAATPNAKNVVSAKSKTPNTSKDDATRKSTAGFLIDSTPQNTSLSSNRGKPLNAINSKKEKEGSNRKNNIDQGNSFLSGNTMKDDVKLCTKDIAEQSVPKSISSKTPKNKTKSKSSEKIQVDSKATPNNRKEGSLPTRSAAKTSIKGEMSTNKAAPDRITLEIKENNPYNKTKLSGGKVKSKLNRSIVPLNGKKSLSGNNNNTTINTTTTSTMKFRHNKPDFQIYEDSGIENKLQKIPKTKTEEKDQKRKRKEKILKDLTNSTLKLKVNTIHDQELCISKSMLVTENSNLPVTFEKSKDVGGTKSSLERNNINGKERSKGPLCQTNNSVGLKNHLHQTDKSAVKKNSNSLSTTAYFSFERENKENITSTVDAQLLTSKSAEQRCKHKEDSNKNNTMRNIRDHTNLNENQTGNEKVLLNFKRKKSISEEMKCLSSSENSVGEGQGSGSLEIPIIKKPRSSQENIESKLSASKKECTLSRFSRTCSKDHVQTSGIETEKKVCDMDGKIKGRPLQDIPGAESKEKNNGTSGESLVNLTKSNKSQSKRKSIGSQGNKRLLKKTLPITCDVSTPNLRVRKEESSSLKKAKEKRNEENYQEDDCSYSNNGETPLKTTSVSLGPTVTRKRRRLMSEAYEKIFIPRENDKSGTCMASKSQVESISPSVQLVPLQQEKLKSPSIVAMANSESNEERKQVTDLATMEDKKGRWFCRKMKEFANFRLPISHFPTSTDTAFCGPTSVNDSGSRLQETKKLYTSNKNREEQDTEDEAPRTKRRRSLKIWEMVENKEPENNTLDNTITSHSTTSNSNVENHGMNSGNPLLHTPKVEKDSEYVDILNTSTIVYCHDNSDLLRLFKVQPQFLREDSRTPVIHL